MAPRWIVLLLALTACVPEIYDGAYLCGPEQTCPEGQTCDPSTAVCQGDPPRGAFACPDGSDADEPDDVQGDAPRRAVGCLGFPVEWTGCVTDAGDVDRTVLEIDAACVGRPLRLDVRTAIAFGQPEVTLLDASGQPLSAASCTTTPGISVDAFACVATDAATATTEVRVTMPSDGTCDGACAFNRYALRATATPP